MNTRPGNRKLFDVKEPTFNLILQQVTSGIVQSLSAPGLHGSAAYFIHLENGLQKSTTFRTSNPLIVFTKKILSLGAAS